MNLKSAKKLAHSLITLYREHHNTEEKIDFMEGLEERIEHFKSISGLGPSIFYVFRTGDRKVVYLQGDVESILGYNNAYFQKKSMWMLVKLMKLTHLIGYLQAAIRFYSYLYSIPIQERLKAKGTAVFPLVNRFNEKKIVFQQWSVHKLDSKGNIAFSMNVITDITHISAGMEPKIYMQIPGYMEDHLHVFDRFRDFNSSTKVDSILTPSEQNILKHTAQGLTSKQIAYELGLSSHTVNNHKKNILNKLGVASMAEAIRHSNLNYI